MKFALRQNSQTQVPVGRDVGDGLDRLPHVAFLACSKEPALIQRNVDLECDERLGHRRNGPWTALFEEKTSGITAKCSRWPRTKPSANAS